MLQDIAPHRYHCEYRPRKPGPKDYVLLFHGDQVLLDNRTDQLQLPAHSLAKAAFPERCESLRYLFSIDDSAFFLAKPGKLPQRDGFAIEDLRIFRGLEPSWMGFAGITGSHLYRWYTQHRYCGKCGNPMKHSREERAMVCEACDIVKYPQIAPAVIVGVTDGERILLTRYAGRAYTNYALIAGFMEIGETLEDTVRREVLEETGVRVTDITYFKNQPWGFSDSLLVGFFAKLDGSPEITMDDGELSEAVWIDRKDIPLDGSSISLTYEMMKAFRDGLV